MRCAAPRILLSNNPAALVFLGVFGVGTLFFALGTLLVRWQRRVPATIPGVSDVPLEVRLDYVERLAIVGAAWCIAELETLCVRDPDAELREAAAAAIVVIRSRGY